jgi:hypothetical protein
VPTLTETRPGAQDHKDDRPAVRSGLSSGRTLALVAVFLAITLMLFLPVRSWLGQRSGLTEMQIEIEQAQQRVDSLRQQRSQWQNPAFIEEQARLRLNLVRAGEAGLVTLDEGSEPSARKSGRQSDSWWGLLWGSVDELSGRRAADAGRGSSLSRTDPPR